MELISLTYTSQSANPCSLIKVGSSRIVNIHRRIGQRRHCNTTNPNDWRTHTLLPTALPRLNFTAHCSFASFRFPLSSSPPYIPLSAVHSGSALYTKQSPLLFFDFLLLGIGSRVLSHDRRALFEIFHQSRFRLETLDGAINRPE